MTDNGTTPLTWEERRRYREEGFEVTLPIGQMKARIRSVDLGWFLTRLNLNDLLTPLVDTLIRQASGEETEEQYRARRAAFTQEEHVKEELASIELYGEFAKFCMVHPRVVDNPQGPDEISLEDIGTFNARWLYQRCTLPVEHLKRICEESEAVLDAVADEPGSERPPKRSRRSGAVDRA